MKFLLSRSSLNQKRIPAVTGGLAWEHAAPVQPCYEDVLVEGLDHPLHVALDDVGGVGVGAVQDGLNLGSLTGFEIAGKVVGDHQGQADFPGVHAAADVVEAVHPVAQIEILGPLKVPQKVLADAAILLVVDRGGHIFNVEGEGVAVQDEEDHRQEDHLDEALVIPADVNELFSEDGPGAFQVHVRPLLPPAGSAR